MSKYNIIDLFSGCGGLLDGFLQTGKYYPVASVEWEKRPAETLVKRLEDKWNIADAKDSVIRFDIQRVDELFNGFDDIKYGKHDGLEKLIKKYSSTNGYSASILYMIYKKAFIVEETEDKKNYILRKNSFLSIHYSSEAPLSASIF